MRKKARMSTLTTSFNIVLEVLTKLGRQEKEVKFALFPDDMILYVENPKYFTKQNSC